jgi:hypothetical protein
MFFLRENRVFTGAFRWHTGAAAIPVAASVFVYIRTLVTVL